MSIYDERFMVDTVRGVFRSDDTGTHWTRINDMAHQWGSILQITGNPPGAE